MKVIRSVTEMAEISEQLHKQGKSIGFVPTMGYLHDGHFRLLEIAQSQSDILVLSVFVNPTQFSPNEDFKAYPRDEKRDEKLAEKSGVHYLFIPRQNEMYPINYSTFVKVEKLSSVLCGASRPLHFRGVATVVTKLFNIVKPTCAVFGQKDAQQFIIIRKMVTDLNMNIRLVMGPIVREPDGLALSSRNVYLDTSQKKQATILCKSLQRAQEMYENGETNAEIIRKEMESMIETQPDAKIDYVEIISSRSLEPVRVVSTGNLIALAVRFGHTRLIDNIIIGNVLEETI